MLQLRCIFYFFSDLVISRVGMLGIVHPDFLTKSFFVSDHWELAQSSCISVDSKPKGHCLNSSKLIYCALASLIISVLKSVPTPN